MDNSQQLTLAASIEAILFYTAEPISLRKLASLTKTDVASIREAVTVLHARLEASEGGIRLLEKDGEVALGTAPSASALIEQITREEISKELSKAALETLSIVCYKGPLTRSEIDYVRGVNSTFILRNLLIRGIVEKLENPKDARAALYGATFAALEYMGVTRKEDLPQFAEIQAQMQAFLADRTLSEEDVESKPDMAPQKIIDESGEGYDGDGDSVAALCDTNGDGILSAEECEETVEDSNQEEAGQAEVTDFDADIAEENLMAPAFDDAEVSEHNAKDKNEAGE